MNTRIAGVVALALTMGLLSGRVVGNQLPLVQVRASAGEAIQISCKQPVVPTGPAIGRLLTVHDPDQANRLRFKVARAAAQACAAGTAEILVERSGDGRDIRWMAGN